MCSGSRDRGRSSLGLVPVGTERDVGPLAHGSLAGLRPSCHDDFMAASGQEDLIAAEVVGVAEAKRRFSELIERVERGERFLVLRRGKPALALVNPGALAEEPAARPLGLAAFAGALGDWEGLEQVVAEVYRARRTARDRAAPDLG